MIVISNCCHQNSHPLHYCHRRHPWRRNRKSVYCFVLLLHETLFSETLSSKKEIVSYFDDIFSVFCLYQIGRGRGRWRWRRKWKRLRKWKRSSSSYEEVTVAVFLLDQLIVTIAFYSNCNCHVNASFMIWRHSINFSNHACVNQNVWWNPFSFLIDRCRSLGLSQAFQSSII